MPHHHPRLPAVFRGGVADKAGQPFDWTRRRRPQQHARAAGPGGLPRGSPHQEDQSRVAGTYTESNVQSCGDRRSSVDCGCTLSQAQPIEVEVVRKILGNKATFSAIVTLEPRRRKFHKPITMTLPIPKSSNSDGASGVYSGGTPTLRLLCSITGRWSTSKPNQTKK